MNEIPKNQNEISEPENYKNETDNWQNSDGFKKKDLVSLMLTQFSLILFCFLVHFLLTIFLTSVVFNIDRIPEGIKNYSNFEIKELQIRIEKETAEIVSKNPELIKETFIQQATLKSPSILFVINLIWILSFILPAYILFKNILKDKFNLLSDELNLNSIQFGLKSGLYIFLFITVISVILYLFQIKIPSDNFQKELIRNIKKNPYLLLWAIYTIAIITGIIEEIFFRGILLHQFLLHEKPKEGLFITSIIFGFMHNSNEGSILIPIILTLVGFVFGFVYSKTKNIWAPISAHILYNSLILLMAYFFGDKIYK